ncbi:MAG: thioredoxin domain-containing protein [archaeon]
MSKKILIIALIFFTLLMAVPSFAQTDTCSQDSGSCAVPDIETISDAHEVEEGFTHHTDPTKVCIAYFYSPLCSHCENLKPFIDSIEQAYSNDIILTRYDVTEPQNVALYNKLCQSKNYEEKKIPLLAINDRILVGEPEIKDNLDAEIQRGISMEEKICPLEGMQCTTNQTQGDRDPLIPQLGEKLEWQAILPLILFTGLADGINPCAFAVLLFIMAFLLEISNSRKRLIKITTAYITALLSVNILLGILYYYTSMQLHQPAIIRNIAITLALIAGAINIKDYFWYGKGITLKIPESSKKHIQALTKKATVPAAVFLGSLVALLEAPCSIPIYLTVVEVLKGHGQNLLQIMPYIFTYNLMFILPLVLLAGIIYYGGEAKALEKWRDSHKRTMKLMLGAILILLALAMLFGYI